MFNEEKFVQIAFERIKERVTGESQQVLYDDKPSQTFFVGSLCNMRLEEERRRSIRTLVAPFNAGVEFLLRKSDLKNAKVLVRPSGAVYYKRFPTFEEQFDYSKSYAEREGKKDIQTLIREDEEREASGQPPRLNICQNFRVVFEKIRFSSIEILLEPGRFFKPNSSSKDIFHESGEISRGLFQEFARRLMKYRSKAFSTLKTADRDKESKVPLLALRTKKHFDEFLGRWGASEVKPRWNPQISWEVKDFNDEFVSIKLLIQNGCQNVSRNDLEDFIFEAGLEVKINDADLPPYILEYLSDYYRFDGNIEANGINCSVDVDKNLKMLRINHLPTFKQKGIESNATIPATFEELADNPIPALEKILVAMETQKKENQKIREEILANKMLSQMGVERMNSDIKSFEDEARRFREGLNILKNYPLAVEAFKLMNRSFMRSSKGFKEWRLFQIVFIVMNLADIASTEYPEIKHRRDEVAVIYFPTGGGKTEAYLGLVVLCAFFDRLRGKKAGTTAITKFPLRLLSLDQLQRIADIFASAEIVRREISQINAPDFEQFSLGFYIGEGSTPNKLMKEGNSEGDVNYIEQLSADPDQGDKFLFIPKCPFCGQRSVKIKADKENLRILHACENPSCKEVLPIHISDDEIYRYLPTFIVGTIDKIAVLGWKKEFRHIFGQVRKKCPKHGYYSGLNCVMKGGSRWGCNLKDDECADVSIKDPTPTLLIQDELHLIRESLGSFAAHYESFIDWYQQKISGNGKRMKIIAATATMSDEWRMQTTHLYVRNAFRFPSQGIASHDSFYAKATNKTQRLIVGLAAHNKTNIYTMLDIIRIYEEFIQECLKDPSSVAKSCGGTVEEAKKSLLFYATILSYHLAKRDGDAVVQSVSTMANRVLEEKGFHPIVSRMLTGDVSFPEIKAVKKELEEEMGKVDLVSATSLISHGIDVEALNFIVFEGMPKNNAEYIQALSRTGRQHTGLAIVAFNNTLERDLSYYQYFRKFHEFRDILVEAVPLNRWAKFSIDPTLPGIFIGAVLNYFDLLAMKEVHEALYMSGGFNKYFGRQPFFLEDDLVKFVQDAYGIDPQKRPYFSKVVQEGIRGYIDDITRTSQNTYIASCLRRKPMRSLRDIGEAVEVSPTHESYQLIKNARALHTNESLGSEAENNEGGEENAQE